MKFRAVSMLAALSGCGGVVSDGGAEDTDAVAPADATLGVLAPVSGQVVRPGAPFSVRVRYAGAEGGVFRVVGGDQEATRVLSGASGTAEARLVAPAAAGTFEVTVAIEVPGHAPVRATLPVTVNTTVAASRCILPGWWDGDGLPGRLTVRTQHFAGQGARPVSLDLDIGAMGREVGFEIDPRSFRLVEQRCDGTFAELPVQWSDGFVALLEKRSHGNPLGDGVGSVTWTHSADPTGGEITPGGAELHSYALYFGSSAHVVEPEAPTWGLFDEHGGTNGLAQIRFAGSGGRLLDEISYAGGVDAGSMQDSCCGNGVQTSRLQLGSPGWSPAGDAETATHGLREFGPVFALWETTGVVDERDRETHPFAYEYRNTTMVFHHSADVWMSVYQVGLTEIRNDHLVDPALGIRPFELRLAVPSRDTTPRRSFGNLAGVVETRAGAERDALAFGFHQSPLHVMQIGNPARLYDGFPAHPRFVYLAGNDALDIGGEEIASLPAGQPWFDEVGVVLRPLPAFESFVARDFLPMLNAITVNPEGMALRPVGG